MTGSGLIRYVCPTVLPIQPSRMVKLFQEPFHFCTIGHMTTYDDVFFIGVSTYIRSTKRRGHVINRRQTLDLHRDKNNAHYDDSHDDHFG